MTKMEPSLELAILLHISCIHITHIHTHIHITHTCTRMCWVVSHMCLVIMLVEDAIVILFGSFEYSSILQVQPHLLYTGGQS